MSPGDILTTVLFVLFGPPFLFFGIYTSNPDLGIKRSALWTAGVLLLGVPGYLLLALILGLT